MCTVSDWLALHELKAPVLRDILTAYYMGELKDYPSKVEDLPTPPNAAPKLGSQSECFETYVIPALVDGCPEQVNFRQRLQSCKFNDLADPKSCWPHTVDRGLGQPPLIVMNWGGQAADLICLAHEAAHALQIILSGNDTMPPIARETCAFIGERLLLRFVEKSDPVLHLELEQVWAAENAHYLLENLDILADGLLSLGVPYHYCMNYPLARLAAVRLSASDSVSLMGLFSSGASAMKHLPLEEMAAQTATLTNYFPKFPDPDPNTPKLDFYRNLGAVTVLDLEANNSWVRLKLQDYYSALQAHLFEDTAIIWLSEDQRPMGCATWAGQSNDNTFGVTRLTAPFGGHARLQQLLDQKLKAANSNECHQRGDPA